MKKLDVDKAVELWTTGTAIKVIAARLGTTEKTLQKFMKGNEDYFPARKKKVKKSLSQVQMDKAIQMWEEKYSLREIGNAIGKTKNAVSGLMSRNRDVFPERFGDLKKVAYSAKSIPKGGREEKRKATLSANKIRQIFHEALNPSPPPKPKEQWSEYDQSRMPGISLVDLDTSKCCRWPITEYPKGTQNMFCGEVNAGKNYCSNHAQRSVRTA